MAFVIRKNICCYSLTFKCLIGFFGLLKFLFKLLVDRKNKRDVCGSKTSQIKSNKTYMPETNNFFGSSEICTGMFSCFCSNQMEYSNAFLSNKKIRKLQQQ